MTNVPQPQDDRLISFGGRTFPRFCLQTGTHCVPVDEAEEIRQDELCRILRRFLTRTVLPPFPPPNTEEPIVLDCGFGKGTWIDDLLSEHNDCDVTGIDIFLGRGLEEEDSSDDESNSDVVQEFVKKRWNLNASFREDRSATRLGRDRFHLINSRLMVEGIDASRWPSYIEELRKMLRPGGWVQLVELDLMVQSWNGTLPDTSCLSRWWNLYKAALGRLGKNAQASRHLGQLLSQQGFENVSASCMDLPIGSWRPGLESVGGDIRDNLAATLETFSLWPFRGRIGGAEALVDETRYRLLIEGAKRELMEDRMKLYYRVHYAYGQRRRR